jgi:FAD/FMN-containing dehydrogenase
MMCGRQWRCAAATMRPYFPAARGRVFAGSAATSLSSDFSKHLNRILEIDAHRRVARVEPGVVLDDLREAARVHGLTFAPDPATHNHNTLGGMIGNNSCGPHSVMGGTTVQNVVERRVLTYDGMEMTVGETPPAVLDEKLRAGGRTAQIYRELHRLSERYGDEVRRRFPGIPRRVSGFNLNALLPENRFHVAQALVGSEGTCVVVLEAMLRLVPRPAETALLVLGYKDVYEAGDHVVEVMEAEPIALEGIDDRLVRDITAIDLDPGNLALLPEGGGWLLVEFGGASRKEARERADAAMRRLRRHKTPPTMKVYDDPDCEHRIWKIRESGLGATAHVPNRPITWEGGETPRCRRSGWVNT